MAMEDGGHMRGSQLLLGNMSIRYYKWWTITHHIYTGPTCTDKRWPVGGRDDNLPLSFYVS